MGNSKRREKKLGLRGLPYCRQAAPPAACHWSARRGVCHTVGSHLSGMLRWWEGEAAPLYQGNVPGRARYPRPPQPSGPPPPAPVPFRRLLPLLFFFSSSSRSWSLNSATDCTPLTVLFKLLLLCDSVCYSVRLQQPSISSGSSPTLCVFLFFYFFFLYF